MERWRGKIAVVTGASGGIGAAIAYQLQDAGLHVVGLARRVERIPSAVDEARKGAQNRGRKVKSKALIAGKLHSIKCDVSKEEDILAAFQWIKDNVGGIHVLVNNAGVIGENTLYDAPVEEFRTILEVNVLGLSVCTKEAINLMRTTNVDDGQIIHVSSHCAHYLPTMIPSAMYYASKHAVRILLEGLRKELVAIGSHIRVMEVSPGIVKTEILQGMKKASYDKKIKEAHLWSEDIADIVLYAISAPPHVQVHEVIVLPVGGKI